MMLFEKNKKCLLLKTLIIILFFTIYLYPISSFAIKNATTRTRLQHALNQYRAETKIPGIAMSITSHDKNNPSHYLLVSGTISQRSNMQ